MDWYVYVILKTVSASCQQTKLVIQYSRSAFNFHYIVFKSTDSTDNCDQHKNKKTNTHTTPEICEHLCILWCAMMRNCLWLNCIIQAKSYIEHNFFSIEFASRQNDCLRIGIEMRCITWFGKMKRNCNYLHNEVKLESNIRLFLIRLTLKYKRK